MTATAVARVLTAQDDPVVSSDLRLVLEGAGFAVCADARDGLEAVALARRFEPDVVLLDLGLPRLDGLEATRRILAEREVPIVALVGRSDALAEDAVDAGATSTVRKPIEPARVVSALRDALVARLPGIEALREESRAAIRHMAVVLGYPEGWAEVLERRAFAQGRVWRIQRAGDGADASRASTRAQR